MKELMRESIGGKREIFLKVEEVLQGCYETSLDQSQLWIPQFKMRSVKNLPYLTGFQTDATNFVGQSEEVCDVEVTMPSASPAGIIATAQNAMIFEEDFIFGAVHGSLSKTIDIPLFVSLIEKDDWRKTIIN